MINTTFSILFSQLASASDLTKVSDIHTYLQNQDVDISYDALASYKAFRSVPRLEIAQQILSAFNYEITQDELLGLLEYSKEELREYKSETNKSIVRSMKLNPAFFSASLSSDELSVILEQRSNELSLSFNSYLSSLIKKDLIESGFISDNTVEEEV